jgi:hypothetical protein
MARRIIILRAARGPGRDTEVEAAFWADVPPERQGFYANDGFVSAVVGAEAPTTAELDDLRAGRLVESVRRYDSIPEASTVAQIKARLVTEWTAFQEDVTARNLWPYYGTSYDPATGAWTNKTVA